MNNDLLRAGMIVLLLIIAGTVFVFSREVLVILTSLFFVGGMVLTRRSPDRDFYAFVISVPLIVTIGEISIPAGLVALMPALGLLTVETLQNSNPAGYLGLIAIPLILAGLVVIIPEKSRILYLVMFLLATGVTGSSLFLVRNHLLKEHYMRDTP